MTIEEKVAMVREMVDDPENEEPLADTTIRTFLTIAESKIKHKAFPLHPEEEDMPVRYEVLQCEIAAYLINKRGAEGQTRHNENGIERTYESASVPNSMLDAVVPFSRAFEVKNEKP